MFANARPERLAADEPDAREAARESAPPSFGPSSTILSTSPHFRFLDGVRGCAALYVVLHHIAIHVPLAENVSATDKLLRFALSYGHYAVDVFIVLSGYCLMLPVLRSRSFPIGTFIKRRAVRILPPYYFSMFASWLLIATVIGEPTGTHWDLSIPVSKRDVLTHFLLIHDWVPSATAKINHTHWSVAVEWKIYLLFPGFLLLWRRWGPLRTVLFATATSYTVWLVQHHYGWLNPSPWGSSAYYIALFSFGMYVAELGEACFNDTRALALKTNADWPPSVWSSSFSRRASTETFTRCLCRCAAYSLASGQRPLLLSLRISSLPKFLSRPFQLRSTGWLGQRSFSLQVEMPGARGVRGLATSTSGGPGSIQCRQARAAHSPKARARPVQWP